MTTLDLSPPEQRVVGCLIEKEMATPEHYPLTLNALRAACNQTSNRTPVVAYDEATVSTTLDGLRGRSLTRIVHSRTNRSEKYRHVLDEVLEVGRPELALLSVLLLRGPQTLNELRTRTERLHRFATLDEVEGALDDLARRDEPLVAPVPRAPGQREQRYTCLLGAPSPASVDDATTADPGDLARRIEAVAHLRGSFTLRSGATSDRYFDKYRIESDPRLLRRVAEGLAALVPPGTEALAGLELGGVPLATMVSSLTGLPCLFVRKEAKTYGTCQLAEGGEVARRRLCVVEDVVTSGGQVAMSCLELRERGATVTHALCVIDREAGGREALAAEGIALRSLFTMSELLSS